MESPALVVSHWRRFGHDRLYVTLDGSPIGWWDLATGEPHAKASHLLPELQTALVRWKTEQMVTPSLPPDSPVTASGLLPTAPDRDLADREPGAALLVQARAAREAAVTATSAALRSGAARPSALRRLVAWAFGLDATRPLLDRAGRVAERPWLVGAEGEREVAAVLAGLTRTDSLWQALHSVPVGSRGSDIDHVVLGPGGVFTVNTKHHPRGTVWVGGDVVLVNGQTHPYVRNSRHEADRATRLLSAACGFHVPVRGLVVTVGATLRVKAAPADVVVLDHRALAAWLRGQSPGWTTETLGRVHDAARHESTWTRTRPPESPARPAPALPAMDAPRFGTTLGGARPHRASHG